MRIFKEISVMADENEEYEVEKIVDYRLMPTGLFCYSLKWKDYGDE